MILQARRYSWYWTLSCGALLFTSTPISVWAEDQVGLYKIEQIEMDLSRIQNEKASLSEKRAKRCSFLPVRSSFESQYPKDNLQFMIETGAYIVVDKTGNELPIRFKEIWTEATEYPTYYRTSAVPSGGCGAFLLARIPGQDRTATIPEQPQLAAELRDTSEQLLGREEKSLISHALCSARVTVGVPAPSQSRIYVHEPFVFCNDPAYLYKATDKSEKPHWLHDGKDWYIFRHYYFAPSETEHSFLDTVFLFKVDSKNRNFVPSVLYASNGGEGTISCNTPIAVDVGRTGGFSVLFDCTIHWEPGMGWSYLVHNHSGKWH